MLGIGVQWQKHPYFSYLFFYLFIYLFIIVTDNKYHLIDSMVKNEKLAPGTKA